MCKPLTLNHTKQGYISWCQECNRMNIAFGTIVFALSPAQFQGFIGTINQDVIQYNGKVCVHEKSLLYNTDSNLVNMVLCYEELVVLSDLLNQAWVMYETQQILNP